MNEAEAREAFAKARVARLATLTPDGAPHIVPICFAVDGDVIYSAIDHKPKRTTHLQRLRNINCDARVAVLAEGYRCQCVTIDDRAGPHRRQPTGRGVLARRG